MASLGIELAASRLLAPFFGQSLLVWANLIGVILIYLSAGYWLGGRWADRDPRPRTLLLILAAAGVTIGLLPLAAQPVLELAIPALAQLNAQLGVISFLGVVVLFAVPVTLLGCVPPFALRLAAPGVNSIGATGGSLYALSTIGSILGVYLSVFWMIPTLGVRRTFLAFAVALVALASLALWQARQPRLAAAAAAVTVLLVALAAFGPGGPVKPLANVIYESESAYNYIQVIQEDGYRLLTVNEGQAYQSVYYPDTVLLGGYWDLFLLTPYLTSPEPPASLLVIGLAGGTVTRQFGRVYPGIRMVGVEIDPEIVAVGRDLFEMNEPNLNVIVDDGRSYLYKTSERYDLIIVDAYRQPYVPFHLATVEYYRELKRHLTPRGVVAVNAARTPQDDRLVRALAATLRHVFPTVIYLDYPQDANTLIVAAPQAVPPHAFVERLTALEHPVLGEVAASAAPNVRPAEAVTDAPVFTDDLSNVENLIHSIILDATVGAAP
jgi:spermidine synthase